jgi:hypothetical protein
MNTVALRPTRKPINKVPVGSIVHVSPRIAKVLLALRLAEEVATEAPVLVSRRKVETAAKPKRAYKRRDMQAEE